MLSDNRRYSLAVQKMENGVPSQDLVEAYVLLMGIRGSPDLTEKAAIAMHGLLLRMTAREREQAIRAYRADADARP